MYDQARADRAVNFIKLLKHTKGKWAGVPFNLQPWQENEIIRPLFGTVNPDGTRQYRTSYIQEARKNGKSEIASGIALYMLFADGEMGAEIYSAAADREQASIVFNTGIQMIRQNKSLFKRCKIIESQRRVIVPGTNSFWRVLSADAFTKHGLNPHCVIFDELHAQPNRELWDVLSTGFGAREQPLLIAITTAGYDKNSICYEQYDYAQRIIKGDIEDKTFFPVIFEVPPDADWRDEKLWKLANPGLGEFRNLDELRQMAARAAQVPAFQNTFRRLYLDQWTEQAERWLDMAKWDESAGEVNLDELEGQECYGGLDLASTTDIVAFVLMFPREDKNTKIVPLFWIPKDNMHERVKRDRVPYDVWVRDGQMKTTDGNVADYATIREDIIEASKRWNIKEIAYDRWNATQLVQDLMGEGLEMVPMGQGFASMSAPTKEFEVRLLSKSLHHGGNPVLRWMAGNVQAAQDAAGNIKPDKKKSTEKIDGIVASVMALDRVVRHETDGPSVYEERDMIVL
ncbi:MAG: terminase TerL endonuclease subunit [Armatimonadota bacterium]